MRDAFARSLYEASKSDDRIFFVVADISPASSLDDFLAANPTRFIDVGVSEQSLIGISAGLAMRGYRPFAYTIANFTIYRPFEQIRVDLCYQELPVVLVGVGGGMAYSALGSTHHTIEDVAVMSALPNMSVVAPCDPAEVEAAVRASFQLDGPLYLRLGKAGEPDLTGAASEPFQFGKIRQIIQGNRIAIVGYGPILGLAIEAAHSQNAVEAGSVSVYSAHTLKPLDKDRLCNILETYEHVITLEEHVAFGSLGSQAKQLAFERHINASLECLNLSDRFIHSYGTHSDVREAHGISSESVHSAIRAVLTRENRQNPQNPEVNV